MWPRGTKDDVELLILLLKCWAYGHALPCPVYVILGIKSRVSTSTTDQVFSPYIFITPK